MKNHKNSRKADYQAAVEMYREQIATDPNNGVAHERLAQCLYQSGEYESAWKEAELAIKLLPNAAKSYLILSSILASRKDYEQAELMARRAIDIDPGQWESFNNLASILDSLGKSEEGQVLLQEAITLSPNDWRPHFSLSILLYKTRRYSESIREARTAFWIHPTFQTAYWLFRALCYYRQLLCIFIFASLSLIAPVLQGVTSFIVKLLLVLSLLFFETGEMLYENSKRGKRGLMIVLILGVLYLIFGKY